MDLGAIADHRQFLLPKDRRRVNVMLKFQQVIEGVFKEEGVMFQGRTCKSEFGSDAEL